MPASVILPRSAREFGAAIAPTVALAGWAAVRHVRSTTHPGIGAVVAAVVLSACVVLFGTNDVCQSVRPDPTCGTYPPFHLRVLWPGATSAATHAVLGVLGVLGAIAWLGRRPAPGSQTHRGAPADERRTRREAAGKRATRGDGHEPAPRTVRAVELNT
ncbi:hypothetical protein DQ353_08710 [Arthrobacter sp. AQ5-05]|nr:hypothetical protein DQ353_08710 [Arthrobacter sp. AQ5-05]